MLLNILLGRRRRLSELLGPIFLSYASLTIGTRLKRVCSRRHREVKWDQTPLTPNRQNARRPDQPGWSKG